MDVLGVKELSTLHSFCLSDKLICSIFIVNVSVERPDLSRLQSLTDVFLQKNNIKAHLPKWIRHILQFKPLIEAVAALICLRVLSESIYLWITFFAKLCGIAPKKIKGCFIWSVAGSWVLGQGSLGVSLKVEFVVGTILIRRGVTHLLYMWANLSFSQPPGIKEKYVSLCFATV